MASFKVRPARTPLISHTQKDTKKKEKKVQ
jgi:hypothetical protein